MGRVRGSVYVVLGRLNGGLTVLFRPWGSILVMLVRVSVMDRVFVLFLLLLLHCRVVWCAVVFVVVVSFSVWFSLLLLLLLC